MATKSKQSWLTSQGIEKPDYGPRPFIPDGKTQVLRPTEARPGYEKTLPDGQKLPVLLVLAGTVDGRGEQVHEWEVTSKAAATTLHGLLENGPAPISVKRSGSGTDTAYAIEALEGERHG